MTADRLRASPWLVPLALFLAPAAVLVLIGFNDSGVGYAAYDQRMYHLPAITRFAQEWPHVDLRDYSSATTPGYHLLMAAVYMWSSGDVIVLRLFNLALTVALLSITGIIFCRGVHPIVGGSLCAPFFFSIPVFASGVWLTTDNLAWIGVVAALTLALRGGWRLTTSMAASVGLAALVCVRQIHLWVAAPVALSMWRTRTPERGAHAPPQWAHSFAAQKALWVVILFSLSAASLGWLFSQWGGMVPPSFQYKEGHLTLSAMAFTLVLAGCYGPFFATCVLEGQGWSSKLRSLSGRELRLMAVGAVVATVVGALAPTSYEEPARASALWNLAKLVPAFGVHSPVMIVLSGVGGAMATLVALRLCESDRYIIAAAFAAFVAAHSTNLVLYQRYYEPFILIVLSLSANRIVAAGSRPTMSNRSAWWVAVGPLALGVGQLLITAWKVASPEVLLTVVRS